MSFAYSSLCHVNDNVNLVLVCLVAVTSDISTNYSAMTPRPPAYVSKSHNLSFIITIVLGLPTLIND